MCQEGRAREVRKSLANLLSTSSGQSKAEQKHLLDNLLHVELCTGRTIAALRVLKRRRALGYPTVGKRMDAALHTASLLQKVGRFMDAHAELIGILQDRRSLHWDGLLSALSLFVDVDEHCREQMNIVLVEGCKAVIERFGIPLPLDDSVKTITQTIRGAQEKYRSDSRAYSALICRAMTEKTPDGRARLINEIREFPNENRVEFFKDQARNLLNELTSKS